MSIIGGQGSAQTQVPFGVTHQGNTVVTLRGTRSVGHTKRRRDQDRASAIRSLTAGQSVVYAMRLSDGTIKIGCSSELHRRRRNVEAGAEILGFMPGGVDDEKAIHAALVPHRARGLEFYFPTADVIGVVNDIREHFNLPPLKLEGGECV